MDSHNLDGGFTNPVLQSQSGFHALMHALANPGTAQPLKLQLAPPAPLSSDAAAILLVVCDHDTPLWLDPNFATPEVLGWLRFHTGAPIVAQRETAAFALCEPVAVKLAAFFQGTDIYPDRSTTLILPVASLMGGQPLALRGPGIETSAMIAPVGLPDDFLTQWAENGTQFPRGVDLLLISDGEVLGLPRTTRISRKDL